MEYLSAFKLCGRFGAGLNPGIEEASQFRIVLAQLQGALSQLLGQTCLVLELTL